MARFVFHHEAGRFLLGPTISPRCSIWSVEVYSHGHKNENVSHFQLMNIYPTKLVGQAS